MLEHEIKTNMEKDVPKKMEVDTPSQPPECTNNWSEYQTRWVYVPIDPAYFRNKYRTYKCETTC
jgi:hypothetical protein